MYGNGPFGNTHYVHNRGGRYGRRTYNPTIGTRVPVGGDNATVQATREVNIVPTQQVNATPTLQVNSGRQTRPHLTGYSRKLENFKYCRCANPTSHGDAFTPTDSSTNYDGIPRLGTDGQTQSWEEFVHRQLDVLGKDYATEPEMISAESRVYHPDTVAAVERQRANVRWCKARTGWDCRSISHGVIWWGPVNPKGVLVAPPPGQGRGVFRYYIGAKGAWDTAEVRPTQRGLSWGASQYNPGGASRR